MMKLKGLLLILSVVTASVLFSHIAGATLVGVNNYVVRDDKGTSTEGDDTYWVRDLTLFANLNLSDTLSAIASINTNPLYSGTWGAWELAKAEDLSSIRDIWYNDPSGYSQISLFSVTLDSDKETLWVGRTLTMWDENNYREQGPLYYKVDSYPFSQFDHVWRESSIYPENDTLGAWVKADGLQGSPANTPIPAPILLLGSGLFGLLGFRRKLDR